MPDWSKEDAEVPGGATHLWEESWDDDDEDEDFSKQLRCVAARPQLDDKALTTFTEKS